MKTKLRTACRFRVTFTDKFSKQKINNPYSEIIIYGNQSLSTFAQAIVKSFGFYYDHCYGFYSNLNDKYKSEEMYELFTELPDIEHTEGAGGVYRTRISDVFPKVGKKMLFLFDYGDNWEFIVEIKYLWKEYNDLEYPVVLRTVGKLPEQYPTLKDENHFHEEEWFNEDCSLCKELREQGIEMKWYPDEPEIGIKKIKKWIN